MAKITGRSPILWIVMVWVLGTAVAVLFGIMGYIADVITATEEQLDEEAVQPYLAFWASAAGNVVGCATATLLAGRPIKPASTVIEATVVENPPV
jgi:hypothetical protein